MKKTYWRGCVREVTGVDYQLEKWNTANIILDGIRNKRMEGFLETVENKWLIKEDNMELIYTSLLYIHRGQQWIKYESWFRNWIFVGMFGYDF